MARRVGGLPQFSSFPDLTNEIEGCSFWAIRRKLTMSSTALAEGTANFLVNRCKNNSQGMHWSHRSADWLLHVRCAVYNGTLGTGFGQRFSAANDCHPQAAIAA